MGLMKVAMLFAVPRLVIKQDKPAWLSFARHGRHCAAG